MPEIKKLSLKSHDLNTNLKLETYAEQSNTLCLSSNDDNATLIIQPQRNNDSITLKTTKDIKFGNQQLGLNEFIDELYTLKSQQANSNKLVNSVADTLEAHELLVTEMEKLRENNLFDEIEETLTMDVAAAIMVNSELLWNRNAKLKLRNRTQVAVSTITTIGQINSAIEQVQSNNETVEANIMAAGALNLNIETTGNEIWMAVNNESAVQAASLKVGVNKITDATEQWDALEAKVNALVTSTDSAITSEPGKVDAVNDAVSTTLVNTNNALDANMHQSKEARGWELYNSLWDLDLLNRYYPTDGGVSLGKIENLYKDIQTTLDTPHQSYSVMSLYSDWQRVPGGDSALDAKYAQAYKMCGSMTAQYWRTTFSGGNNYEFPELMEDGPDQNGNWWGGVGQPVRRVATENESASPMIRDGVFKINHPGQTIFKSGIVLRYTSGDNISGAHTVGLAVGLSLVGDANELRKAINDTCQGKPGFGNIRGDRTEESMLWACSYEGYVRKMLNGDGTHCPMLIPMSIVKTATGEWKAHLADWALMWSGHKASDNTPADRIWAPISFMFGQVKNSASVVPPSFSAYNAAKYGSMGGASKRATFHKHFIEPYLEQ